MHDDLIDRIYEAAFVPELWPDVIVGLSSVSDAADGRLLAFDGIRPIGVKTTELSRDLVESFFFGGVIMADIWMRVRATLRGGEWRGGIATPRSVPSSA
ncbi:hypothetical protein [Mesorhizobium sp. KR9-304]|uniref:hypothetical protein n=1 Tax=Mesorhizobium sp. KR9-304 TaxID=3156614 RepID=UPI0032B5EFB4